MFASSVPLASGQSRAMPADMRSGETGLSKRKWSSMSLSWSASDMPVSG